MTPHVDQVHCCFELLVKDQVGEFFGQRSNPTTYNLCRMNMIMHDVHFSRFDIKNEDTLERPQHIDHRFEAVVANPPIFS